MEEIHSLHRKLETIKFIHRATNLLPEGGEAADGLSDTIVARSDVDIQREQAQIDKIIPDASVTDEEIAELLSGEAEVLKGHGVLG